MIPICKKRYCGILFLLLALPALCIQAQDSKDRDAVETKTLQLADGALSMEAPVAWKSIEPRFDMIEAEFAAPKVGKDAEDARLTIMAAGGSVEDNISRWESQFSQPGGGAVDSTVEEIEIAGLKTHMVDLAGTFADRVGGPSTPPVLRDNYRMLAAIIETDDLGTWFIKFYGGAETVDANAEAFETFVKSLTVK